MSNRNNTDQNRIPPLVRAVHTAVKGRARFKVEGLQGSEALKEHLEFRLARERDIDRVRASCQTGNILVEFNHNRSLAEIASLIARLVRECQRQGSKKVTSTDPNISQIEQEKRARRLAAGSRTITHFTNNVKPIHEFCPEQSTDPCWHILEASAIVTDLQTSKELGLSNESVREKLQRYGPNLLEDAVPRSGLSIFIDQFKSVPVGLLTAAAVLSVATGGLVDAVVIMGVVGINAIIGYATESQSDKIIRSLKSLVKPSALAIRNGQQVEISARDIVLGDILVLRPGSYVSADARLIEAQRLSVDESALTGESMPVTKNVTVLDMPDVPLADRSNMVYMGTLVTGGQGLAVVVATGKYTEMGKIQTLVGDAELPDTPLQKQLDRAGSQLVLISGAVCSGVFGIGLLRGYGWLEMFKTSISLAVAAVPEGLPAVATTTLALGIGKMREKNVLIRRLDAVEALGSVQTICMDKTGTITANKMSVVELYVSDSRVAVVDGKLKFTASEQFLDPYKSEEILKLIEVSVLCNESEINGSNPSENTIKGSSTENALIYMASDAGVDVLAIRQKYPLLGVTHRSEDRNFMSTLHLNCNYHKFLAVKGNPTEVLDLCGWNIKGGKVEPLTDADRLAIELENDRMAGKAMRVLGMAYVNIDNPSGETDACQNLVWLGLVGMADPIRKGVKDLMVDFHQAGIDTVMITGDQSPTAYAIGKELNLSNGKQLEILDSTHLGQIDPTVMRALCDRVHVFARISPAHKLEIVQALQNAGKVVAMTGDGINDAPALKAADIGIAMGHAGTDVAREVADVVLENDNLETMIVAVSQGRTIYNNIRKTVHFLLSTNTSEIVVMFVANAAGIGQPLNAMQLLWLNLVTDIFPGLALALEPPEPDVLNRPPRNPDEPIIKTSDFRRILFESAVISASALGAYRYGIARYGIGPQASTIGFMSLTTGQLLHAISCRSRTHSIFSEKKLAPNPYLTIALIGSLGLQIMSALVPWLRRLMQIAPIGLADIGTIAASALLPLLINEGTKQVPEQDRRDIQLPPGSESEESEQLPSIP